MPFTVQIRATDFGNTMPGAPAITGRISNEPGGVIETVTATATSFGPDLVFVSTATPPAGNGTIYVGNTRTPGDLCRSGVISRWPASPASCEIVTIPPALTTFTAQNLTARAAGFSTRPIPIPTELTVAVGAATGLVFAPTAIAITGVSITLTPPSLMVVTVLGTASFLQFFFPTATPFTANLAFAISPSGDAVDRSRVFSFNLLSSSLNPGVITPGINLALMILAPLVAQFAAGEIEKLLNSSISQAAHGAVTQLDPVASISPTAALCAQRVNITPGTLAVELVLSNPLGRVLVRPTPNATRTFTVSVSPAAVAGQSRRYTIQVSDAATRDPVDGAEVVIRNTTAGGATQTVRAATAAGTAQLTLALRYRSVRSGRNRQAEQVPPTMTVSKTGFSTWTEDLLAVL